MYVGHMGYVVLVLKRHTERTVIGDHPHLVVKSIDDIKQVEAAAWLSCLQSSTNFLYKINKYWQTLFKKHDVKTFIQNSHL